MTEKLKAPPVPCGSCPYRKDVPSGIWAKNEYDKLPEYDGQTWEQNPHLFLCHQRDGHLCGGWLACHDPKELLALRFAARVFNSVDPSVYDYTTDVPVFESGAAARAHGLKDLKRPTAKARKMVLGLLKIAKDKTDMVTVTKYGDIGSIRKHSYTCPHCGRHERTRRLYRKHIADAHSKSVVLTGGERAVLSNRQKKVAVTLATPPRVIVKRLTEAQLRALAAVRDGLVTHVFTQEGNVFHGPKGIGPILYRKLQADHLIEDETGKSTGVIASTHKQRLTEAGRLLLATYGE